MSKSKRILALLVSLSLTVSVFTFSANAVGSFDEWLTNWEEINSSSGYIILTPGEDETQMNFSWQSSFLNSKEQIKIFEINDAENAVALKTKSSFNVLSFEWTHYATATGLKPGTTYGYIYTVNGKESELETFKTGAADDGVKVLFVSDSQIGRSSGEEEEIYQNDTYGWTRTLDTAFANNDGIDFILSSGDQVQDSYSEKQYTYFESPSVLRSCPIAAAIGNHDFYTNHYSYHFNNPNKDTFSLFNWPAGKGYYFSYNDVLFIVIDSNNFMPTANRRIIKNACEEYPDAKWRVLMMHHSPYDAPADIDFTNKVTRDTVVPFIDEFDIDICLSGHDHFYSRSYMIKDNEITADVAENGVYKNPDGTLYLTQNSSSGSNFSGFGDEIAEYCDFALQENRSTYSIVDIVGGKLTVTSYHSDTNEAFDTVAIEKD